MLIAAALILLAVLALSAFFSGSETALMSLNRYRLRYLEQKSRKGAIVRQAVSQPERLLGTILTGNVFVNTAAGALLTYLVTLLVASPELQAEAISIATIFLTALILVFGEMVPKSFAARHPETWSFVVIRPIVFFVKVLGPAVFLLTWLSNGFLRLIGERPRPLKQELSLEEIKSIVYAGGDRGKEPRPRQMLRKVLELGERRISEVMVPRTEIVAVEADASLSEILELIRKRRFSRMPVYRETLDNVLGLIYSKDIIAYWDTRLPFRLSDVIRKPYFLPDGVKVEQALEQMQKQRVHMALVVDEHGGVEGLVTLEDLIEEIVGELAEEGQREIQPLIRRLPDGHYLLDGAIPVKDLNDRLGTGIPEIPDYNTLAGFILSELGRIPREGEEVASRDFLFTVEKVVDRRVAHVRARPALSPAVKDVGPGGGSGHSGGPR